MQAGATRPWSYSCHLQPRNRLIFGTIRHGKRRPWKTSAGRTRLGHPEPEGLVRFGAPEYFDPGTLASLLAQFNSRYPTIDLEIQMGIGTDIAALYGRGLLDVAIMNREIDEADRTGHEDTTVLYREGRVWAALPDMRLDNDRPVPLALFPAPCAWRQLAQERLQSA